MRSSYAKHRQCDTMRPKRGPLIMRQIYNTRAAATKPKRQAASPRSLRPQPPTTACAAAASRSVTVAPLCRQIHSLHLPSSHWTVQFSPPQLESAEIHRRSATKICRIRGTAVASSSPLLIDASFPNMVAPLPTAEGQGQRAGRASGGGVQWKMGRGPDVIRGWGRVF